ncbi:MAG: LCP family protein [Wujia sp.]
MSKQNKKKGLSANAKWGIAFLVEIIIAVLMVIGYGAIYLNQKFDKVQLYDIKEEDLAINEGANEAQKGYTTIALFGIDSRSNTSMEEGNRSDSIMIASINNDTKEVKIVSVYRDTLLEIQDGSGLTTKVNAAYSYGGPELAIKTLNANLDLQITEFVTVNFLALTKAIDDLGGITVDISDGELAVINSGIAEQINITGIYSDGVFTTGEQLLNGTQATAYARIRSTDQGDITRTERQREVLSKMIVKAKSSDLSTINDIIDDVFPNVCTSISKSEMVSLAKSLMEYQLGETVGFPIAWTPVNHPSKGSIIVPANLEANVSALHEFLFGTTDYTPTATVQNISDAVEAETGVGEQEITITPFVAEQ